MVAGVALILLGIAVLLWGRRAVDALARLWRAQARWLAGGNEDSAVFQWNAILTSDGRADRLFRAIFAWLLGAALIVAGVVVLA